MDAIGPRGEVYHNVPEGTNLSHYGLRPMNIAPPEQGFAQKAEQGFNSFLTQALNGPIGSRMVDWFPPAAELRQKVARKAEAGKKAAPSESEVGGFIGDFASPESWLAGKAGGALFNKIKTGIQGRQVAKTGHLVGVPNINPKSVAEVGIAEPMLTKAGMPLSKEVASAAAKPAAGALAGGAAGYGIAGPVGGEFGAALGAAVGGEPIKHTLGGFLTMPLSAAQRAAFSPAVRYQGARMLPGIGNIGGRIMIPEFLKGLVEEENGTKGR